MQTILVDFSAEDFFDPFLVRDHFGQVRCSRPTNCSMALPVSVHSERMMEYCMMSG